MPIKGARQLELDDKGIPEGQECIVDYYAILGIERFSDKKTAEGAYNTLIKRWHPDRVARAAPELQDRARNMTELLRESIELLRDPAKKKAYDAQLKRTHPRLVSTSGIPIQVLGRDTKTFDMGRLLRGEQWDGKEQYVQLIDQLGGHNETLFKVVQRAFRRAKAPTQDLKDAYFHALVKKNTHLLMMEEVAWRDAGISHPPDLHLVSHPSGYLPARIEQFEADKECMGKRVEGVVRQLGPAQAMLLLPPSRGNNPAQEQPIVDPKELQTELTLRLQKQFELYREGITRAAEARAEVLEELVKFTRFEYVPSPQKRADRLVILPSVNELILTVFGYRFDDGKVVPDKEFDRLFGKVKLPYIRSGRGSQKLAAINQSGTNTILLYHNAEIDLGLEIGFVVNKHYTIKKGSKV